MGENQLTEARRQGRLHDACTHPAPAEYTAEEVAAYERGQEEGLGEREAPPAVTRY